MPKLVDASVVLVKKEWQLAHRGARESLPHNLNTEFVSTKFLVTKYLTSVFKYLSLFTLILKENRQVNRQASRPVSF